MTDHHERVRVRAFHLWEAAGYPTGRDQEFWMAAEAEILGAETGAPGEPMAGDETPVAAAALETMPPEPPPAAPAPTPAPADRKKPKKKAAAVTATEDAPQTKGAAKAPKAKKTEGEPDPKRKKKK